MSSKRVKKNLDSRTPLKKNKIKENEIENTNEDINHFVQERLSCANSINEFNFNKKRVKVLSVKQDVSLSSKAILYWMSRDQRVQDNWAFLYAQRLAFKIQLPLCVCFCLVPKFLDATIRHYRFMLKGLQEVAEECKSLDIPFHLLIGEAKNVLPDFIKKYKIGGLITDFSPLKLPKQWILDVKECLPPDIPFCQVDAHNIVPCWIASDKQEYGARTIRKKIHDKLKDFLTEFPPVVKHPYNLSYKFEPIDWKQIEKNLDVNLDVGEVTWAKPGTFSGLKELEKFCTTRLQKFNDFRNDPTQNCLSNLSPWFHFGQISIQRAILTVQKLKKMYPSSVDAFIEEAIIRRELADNFCYYNAKYDQLEGAYEWAKKTLKDHIRDKREYIYTPEQFEKAQTHDPLWNASQLQMVREGKMHGFLRMYWAKKILEWTNNPEEALRIAIYLNDKYELDGRDPNGYVGCMWSICGIHDQGWAERPIFGKIRYMNFKGCQRKFNVDEFIKRYQ